MRLKLAPRTWFRFSLRTLLFVVTTIAVGLGWEVNFVRERKSCVELLYRSFEAREGGRASPYPYCQFLSPPPILPGWHDIYEQPPHIPIWRHWLGDEPYGIISVPTLWPESEVVRIRSLFPEAYVYWNRDELRYYHNRYVVQRHDMDQWITLVAHEFQLSIPAEDFAKVSTVDDAVRYAQARK